MDHQNSRIALKDRDTQKKTEHPGPSFQKNTANYTKPAGQIQKGTSKLKSAKITYHATDMERIDILQFSLQPNGKPAPLLLLFLVKKLHDLAAYRHPRQVREYVLYQSTFGNASAFFLCPRCDLTLDRDYQAFCDRCGQCLNWKRIEKAELRAP
jgi:hypothetical protein